MASIFEGQFSKTRPTFQPKQGSFGFQVYIYIYIHVYLEPGNVLYFGISKTLQKVRPNLPPFKTSVIWNMNIDFIRMYVCKKYIYIYLEPKWGPLFWMEFGPCFGGLTFKNRGHWGSRYIYIYMPRAQRSTRGVDLNHFTWSACASRGNLRRKKKKINLM